MAGREATLATLLQLVPERRLVTIVGLGGVGKSTLALEVASRLADSYPDGTHFVHLAAIGNAASLTEKSLISTEVNEQSARHRLLHTTRAYAYEKLRASADLPHIWRWHAEHHVDLLRTAEVEWETMSRSAWVRRMSSGTVSRRP